MRAPLQLNRPTPAISAISLTILLDHDAPSGAGPQLLFGELHPLFSERHRRDCERRETGSEPKRREKEDGRQGAFPCSQHHDLRFGTCGLKPAVFHTRGRQPERT